MTRAYTHAEIGAEGGSGNNIVGAAKPDVSVEEACVKLLEDPNSSPEVRLRAVTRLIENGIGEVLLHDADGREFQARLSFSPVAPGSQRNYITVCRCGWQTPAGPSGHRRRRHVSAADRRRRQAGELLRIRLGCRWQYGFQIDFQREPGAMPRRLVDEGEREEPSGSFLVCCHTDATVSPPLRHADPLTLERAEFLEY